MITVVNRIFVNPDYTEQFEGRFKNRASMVENMQGFVAYSFLRPTKPDSPYLVMSVWESEADFKAWMDSPSFRKSHSSPLPKEAYVKPSEVEVHVVVDTTGFK